MVPKQEYLLARSPLSFRAVLFRMVPKLLLGKEDMLDRFRAVLFRMVPKQAKERYISALGFRAVLFRMVPKHVSQFLTK